LIQFAKRNYTMIDGRMKRPTAKRLTREEAVGRAEADGWVVGGEAVVVIESGALQRGVSQ